MARISTLTAAIAMTSIASAILMTGTSADARIKSPKLGGSAGYCYSLQSRLDAIVARMTELRKAGNVGAEYNALLKEGRGIMAVWNETCRHAYGSPFYGPPPPGLDGYSLPRPPTMNDKAAPAPSESGGTKRSSKVLDLPLKLRRNTD